MGVKHHQIKEFRNFGLFKEKIEKCKSKKWSCTFRKYYSVITLLWNPIIDFLHFMFDKGLFCFGKIWYNFKHCLIIKVYLISVKAFSSSLPQKSHALGQTPSATFSSLLFLTARSSYYSFIFHCSGG